MDSDGADTHIEDRFDYSNYRLSSPLSEVEPYYDVIVIGSGYGGSIAASRVARAGQQVCLLEKGKEWWPGDFQEDIGAVNDIQMSYHAAGKECVQVGKPTNLYEFVVSPDVAVVQGVGLGGTSLINANVALDADPRVFQDEVWPQALRDDTAALNSVDRQRFLATMQPEEYPERYPPLPKIDAMQRIAKDMVRDIEDLATEDAFRKTPLYVNFKSTQSNAAGIPQPACNNCGNCVGGCNTGAKGTLNMNLLPDAHAHGAKIFTEVQVNAVLRHEESGYWIVFYQDLHHDNFDQREHIIKAKTVILGAGSLGSTRILLNSASRGLAVSSQLGERFTTNGDHLTMSYNGKRKIRPVGIELEDLKSPNQGPGPCITSIVDMRRKPGDHFQQGFHLEDGTPPSSLEQVYRLLLKLTRGEDTSPRREEEEELARTLTGEAFENTIAFLSMSHDSAGGRIVQDPDSGRVWADFPGVGDEENFQTIYEAARKAATTMGGELIASPLWQGLIPQLSGSKNIIAVHPLGGCGMGETGETGVVDHSGAVFKGNSAEVYPDLLVVDGAIMPRSLGINPTLTIGTLAERCIRLLAERNGWKIDYESTKKIDQSVNESRKPGLRFSERMTGTLTVNQFDYPCDFVLTISTDDIQYMLEEDDDHEATLHGTVSCKALSQYPLTVSNGRFHLFRLSEEGADTREMVYDMDLHDHHEKMYHFSGIKVVQKNSMLEIGVGDLTTLAVTITEGKGPGGDVVGRGVVKIQITDFLQQLMTIEVTWTDDIKESLKWKAEFSRFFAGVLLDIYGTFNSSSLGLGSIQEGAPKEEKPRAQRELKLGGKKPEVHRIQATDSAQLLLTRYQGGSKGPLLLLHGLGVSSRIFTLDTVETNLVEFLFEHEYDVWVLDMRYSIMLPYHKQEGYIGDAAEMDLPPTVDYILERTGVPDIQVFAHCAGGMTIHAALLGGHVAPQKIRSLVSSQAGFSLSVGRVNKLKAHARVPSILYTAGLEGISAYPDNMNAWNQRLANKFIGLVAAVTTSAPQHCESDVCHRVTFTYNLLWSHHNVNELTHDTLHEWNGFAHATRLKHFALCMRKGRLVDQDGKDTYLPDFASRRRMKSDAYVAAIKRLDLPILYFNGADNICWEPETTLDSQRRCQEVNPLQHYERFEVADYMHLDCIMGARAAEEVYPRFMRFLETYAHPQQ